MKTLRIFTPTITSVQLAALTARTHASIVDDIQENLKEPWRYGLINCSGTPIYKLDRNAFETVSANWAQWQKDKIANWFDAVEIAEEIRARKLLDDECFETYVELKAARNWYGTSVAV
jgi:hypothetical protein